MNKILLDNNSIINLNIFEDTICNIGNEYNLKELNIKLNNNTKLIINHYKEIENNNLKINILQDNNSEFIYNHSFINTGVYDLNINIILENNECKNTINIHGISDKGISNICIDGKVKENTLNNELYENIKMLNINNGKSKIIPNMYINTKNVIANHAASISDINKDYLFYMNQKGIKTRDAIKLIIDGFLENDAK